MNDAQLRNLDFMLLLVFDRTLQLRNLTAVANSLGVTPSAISHALARLRIVFGDTLFERRPQGVEPTARALELAPQVRAVLGLAEELIDPDFGFDPMTSERHFKIACLDLEMALIGPRLIQEIETHAPSVTVEFVPSVRKRAIDGLASGQLDAAIGFFADDHADLVTQTIITCEYVVVSRAATPLLLDEYCSARHLIVAPGGGMSGFVDEALAGVGRKRRVALSLPYFLPAFELVAQSDLVMTIPRILADRFAGRFSLNISQSPLALRHFTLTVAHHQRARNDHGIAWLCNLLSAEAG